MSRLSNVNATPGAKESYSQLCRECTDRRRLLWDSTHWQTQRWNSGCREEKQERGNSQGQEQFLNEVRILSQVNHRNLVKLLGCCLEIKTAVLVFEFVLNGTLQDHLQGKIEAVPLSWKQRPNIAVQTANALNYLHTSTSFPIYHGDVKSANILLSDDLHAKVADLGISRLASLRATHVSTAEVQGTIGYIDPEYYTSYQLTDKSNVFSFGVVLFELISKPALDFSRGGEDNSLVNLASPYIKRGGLQGLIDPVVIETYNDLADHGTQSILKVGRLAMRCVDMRSKARPTMNEVLKELQNLWVELNSTTEILGDNNEDGDGDARPDDILLLSESCSVDDYSLKMPGYNRSIQLSQPYGPSSFRSRS